jgi:putative PIN family toxin of toxin-antitoxin system
MIQRVVLDTNVCLDLFVFKDPRWSEINKRLASGELIAKTRKDCREEWLAVLNYTHLPLTDENRPDAIQLFDTFIACEEFTTHPQPLAICTDKDDQKFLELTRDSMSAVLITKDKALLKLGKKTKLRNGFSIETPEKFIQNLQNSSIVK